MVSIYLVLSLMKEDTFFTKKSEKRKRKEKENSFFYGGVETFVCLFKEACEETD